MLLRQCFDSNLNHGGMTIVLLHVTHMGTRRGLTASINTNLMLLISFREKNWGCVVYTYHT